MAVISSGSVVAVQSDGSILTAGPSTNPATIAGVATQAGTTGGNIIVTTSGILDGYGGLTAGTLYYMGTNGQPTATRPTSGLLLEMGTAVSSTKLSLRLSPGVILA